MRIPVSAFLFAAGFLVLSVAASAPAGAKNPSATPYLTGMENIHPLSRRGNRLCMVGHFHFGADSSNTSKARALENAKRKWAVFVTMEYGTAWGRFDRAIARKARCSGDRKSGFYCKVKASPCRLLTGKKRRR